MKQESDNEIKALDTYYETANAEHDRIHVWFDQIDNKVGFLIAVVIGVPIATIGFISKRGFLRRWSAPNATNNHFP